MKFTIAIYAPPQNPASRRALCFAESVLLQGHHIERLFFYHKGVYNAINSLAMPQDELDIAKQWRTFIDDNQIDAVVCIAAALRRGMLDSTEATRYNKTAVTIAAPWQLSGLGQLHEAIQNSDRFISFGGES